MLVFSIPRILFWSKRQCHSFNFRRHATTTTQVSHPKPHHSEPTNDHSALLQCLSQNKLHDARQLLDKMSDRPGLTRVVHCTSLLTKLSKSGRVDDARKLFDIMPERNVVTYNAMLSGYVRSGAFSEAFRFFEAMPAKNTVSWTLLLCALLDSGMVKEAVRVFEAMPARNIFSWNSMVSGLIRNGGLERARVVFDRMPEKNVVSWNAMISGYVERCRIEEARALFDAAEDRNVVTWTSMVSGYCRSGYVNVGYSLFRVMPERNVVSWTAMIGGFAWNGFFKEAILLFAEWQKGLKNAKPNGETFVSLAYACAGIGLHSLGKQLHAQVIVNGFDKEACDARLGIALIHMYSTFGFMKYAHFVFVDSSGSFSSRYCSHMINGYIQSRQFEMAESLFDKLPVRDKVSCTSMIAGYLSAGEVSKARRVFTNMPEKDAVACTAMISGLVRNELFAEATAVFCEMRARGISPLSSTYCTLIGATGAAACLDPGKQFHCLVIKTQSESDTILGNSLVSMYAKCGAINDAYEVFSNMVLRDVVSWNSMIAGFSNHGLVYEALKTFGAMVRSETPPDSVTFLGVLSAFSYSGLVSKGREFFDSMSTVYAIRPGQEHYICLIDLLGRAGRVEEAHQLVSGLPFEPGPAVWGALLGICGLAKTDTEIAEHAARRLLEIDPLNGPAHVALCNIYAANDRRVEEGLLRREMGLKGVRKSPGCSWIVMKGRVCVFRSGDEVEKDVDELLLSLVQNCLVSSETKD